jgi:uncharacterized membrane protein YhaH (DUF805 family)
MGFGEAIRSVFSKYVTFSGRARRSEYWYFYLFSILAGMVAGLIDTVLLTSTGMGETFRGSGGPVAAILQLALILPSLAVSVRRLHDTNHSGWLLLGFIAYAIVAVIVFVVGLGAGLAGGQSHPEAGVTMIVGIVMLLGIFGFGIYIFVLMVSNGTPGENRYGADPKGPNTEVFS